MTAAHDAPEASGGIGVGRWVAVAGTVVPWMAHLVALAALVPVACGRPGVEWLMHGLTLVLAGLTGWAAVVCRTMAQGGGDGSRRTIFLGRFGVLYALTNLVLIVAEGAYVLFIDPCA